MSLDFELKHFRDFRIVVLKNNLTGEERKVCQYFLGNEYASGIMLEDGVEVVAGQLEDGRFKGFSICSYFPVAVKRRFYLALSLDDYKCLVDLDKSEILVPRENC